MRDVPLAMVCALALVCGACKPQGSGSGSGPGSAPASCGAGETANASPPFCFKLPGGFKPHGEPLQREGFFSIGFASDDKASIHFNVRELDKFDSSWKALLGNAASSKAADVKEADFADGKGKILTYTTPEKDPRFMISVMLRGAKDALECEAEYRVSSPKPELVDACKSMREP
jgi:hypothetical protein